MRANSATKYAVFIEPAGSLRRAIRAWKRKVARVLPRQPYCAHPPHCTVYLASLTPPRTWLAELRMRVAALAPVALAVEATHVFWDDPAAGNGHTLVFKIKTTPRLSRLQTVVGEALAPFRFCSAADRKAASRLGAPFAASFHRYGFPFLGPHWTPHFTIASLRADRQSPLIVEFLKLRPNFRFQATALSIWRVRGETHTRLARLPLRG